MTLVAIPRQLRNAPRREIRADQMEQVRQGPVEWAKPGQHVWVLTVDKRGYTPIPGLPLIGVFTTRVAALACLRDAEVGPEKFARIEWEASEYNPRYFSGWDEESQTLYLLVGEQIQ